MELLKEVATISGKPGLYRILKPTRTGVIVESIDDKKQRLVINKTTRVSVLSDISVYTRISSTHMMPLGGIFRAMRNRFGNQLPIQAKTATDAELAQFFVAFAPEYDRDRVHSSDIQKIIAWYNILIAHLPELFPTVPAPPPTPAAEPAPAAPVVDMAAPQPEEALAEAPAAPEPAAEAAPAEPGTESGTEPVAAEAPKKKPRARKKAVAEEAKAE